MCVMEYQIEDFDEVSVKFSLSKLDQYFHKECLPEERWKWVPNIFSNPLFNWYIIKLFFLWVFGVELLCLLP